MLHSPVVATPDDASLAAQCSLDIGMGTITHSVIIEGSIVGGTVYDVAIPAAGDDVLKGQWYLHYHLSHILRSKEISKVPC